MPIYTTVGTGGTAGSVHIRTWTAAVTSTADEIWSAWVQAGGCTGTATTAEIIVWDRWNRLGSSTIVDVLPRSRGVPERRILSADRRAELAAAERLAEERLAAQAAAKAEANRKAEKLLRSVLSPQQIEDLERRHCFFVESNGKRYRIERGQHHNVKLLGASEQVEETYCIQPQGGLPDADAMVAQKLLLESDPAMFRSIANITRRDGSFIRGARP